MGKSGYVAKDLDVKDITPPRRYLGPIGDFGADNNTMKARK